MSTPAGWYDDGSGVQRFWDGGAWTPHVAHPVPGEFVPDGLMPGALVPGSPPRKSRVGLYIGFGLAAFVFFGVMVGAGVLVFLQQREASSPGRAFDNILDAWKAKDCPAEYRLSFASTTDTTQEEFCQDADYSWVDAYPDWRVDVTNIDQSFGTATVTTTETFTDVETGDDGSEQWTYTFERVGGKWYYVTSEFIE